VQRKRSSRRASRWKSCSYEEKSHRTDRTSARTDSTTRPSTPASLLRCDWRPRHSSCHRLTLRLNEGEVEVAPECCLEAIAIASRLTLASRPWRPSLPARWARRRRDAAGGRRRWHPWVQGCARFLSLTFVRISSSCDALGSGSRGSSGSVRATGVGSRCRNDPTFVVRCLRSSMLIVQFVRSSQHGRRSATSFVRCSYCCSFVKKLMGGAVFLRPGGARAAVARCGARGGA